MTVTIVCDVLGEKNNGTTLAITNLISYLKEKGHRVKVVCPDKDKEGLEDYYVVPTLKLGKFLGGILEQNGVKLAKVDRELLKNAIEDADVVHIAVPLHLGSVAAKMAKKMGKPITSSFHAQAENVTAHLLGLMDSDFVNDFTYKAFYKAVYKYVDAVHYPTEFIHKIFESAIDKKTNAYVISNGVNKEFFEHIEHKKISDKFVILCTGRFSKEKAQHVLIQAVAESKYKDNIKILFAGSGPKKDKLIALKDELGVDAEFNFYGRKELLDIIHSADLYVHTATVEIEAIACMEAIVGGLVPVICDSPKSATKAFALDEKSLFPMGDVKALTEKIEFWYENPDVKEEYRKKYEGVIGKFRQDDCMEKMEQMLFDTIKLRNEK